MYCFSGIVDVAVVVGIYFVFSDLIVSVTMRRQAGTCVFLFYCLVSGNIMKDEGSGSQHIATLPVQVNVCKLSQPISGSDLTVVMI